uniref:MAT1-1-1 n=1 Tax=Sclerotinia sclerotiorum TaxID=5180 RepID=M1GFY2_SCLSC|nr:MAT1-1-1 [Sclerotinia sclerotiorum]
MKRQQRKLTTTQYRVSKPATKCRRANDSIQPLTYHTAPFIGEIEGGIQHVAMNTRQIGWVEAPRRSVNSYILFRTFYMILNVLGNIPQKYKSAILSVLWGRDPFHAKWSILARAYTLMRDTNVRRTVSEYLALVCPYIGILAVNDYLTDLNWIFETNEEGIVCLRQTSPSDIRSFPAHIARTTLTDLDVITFCGSQGYLPAATAAGIVQGWNRMHPNANMAIQGTLPVTQHIASTQNAYGAWEMPKGVIVAPPPKPAFDHPLTYTLSTPLPTGTLPPPPPWSTGMMAGYWSQDNGSIDLNGLENQFDQFNPTSLGDANSLYIPGDISPPSDLTDS